MLQCKFKAIGQLEERKYHLTLSSLSGTRAFSFYTLSVILEIRQSTQIHLVLLTQLLFELFDPRALSTSRGSAAILRCFHIGRRSCRAKPTYLVSLNSASMTSSAPVGRPPFDPPALAPAPAAVVWL